MIVTSKAHIHLSYSPLDGAFFLLKHHVHYRRIFPDEYGVIFFVREGKKYKIKANRFAIESISGKPLPANKAILHKNLDKADYRLCNLKVVPNATLLAVKEAHRNLSGHLRLIPHQNDTFSYTLCWREGSKERFKVLHDIVVAKRMFNKLQLKFAKVLSRYCVFD